MAKESSPTTVTFYLTRMDGTLNTRETPIYFPSAFVTKGRFLNEDRRSEDLDVVFTNGSFSCNEGSIQDQWLEIYNSGGVLNHPDLPKHDIREKVIIKPSVGLFYVSKKDPLQKTTTVEKRVETIVERIVIPADIAELLTVDQLEQYAISTGIDMGKMDRTKASLTELLKDNGIIVDKK